MKKKILTFALALSLAVGIIGPGTAYADVTASEGVTIETAVEKQFDTDYSVTWDSGAEECWNKLTLEKNGIL